MGLFGPTSPFDDDIEKATSEKKTTEDWSLIMDVCDKVVANPRNGKDCLKSIMRRMAHNDPHVVIQAITLLDACVNNCGKEFHLEVASRDFETEYARLLSKAQPPVALKMKQVLKRWAENEFKTDPQLHLIVTFYQKLKSDGHDFSDLGPKTPKSSTSVAAALVDPNVVSSQQEEDDIAKAIELSLKEAKSSPKKQTTSTSGAYPSLYPSFTGSTGSLGSITSGNSLNSQTEPRKVRALYDFEAVEENEMTFVAGEIIHVQDDSDPNWWKGYNQRGEGLFPSNFVTADLSVEPERLDINQKTKKSVQFEDNSKNGDAIVDGASAEDKDKKYVEEINEEKIDRLLHLLHEANPEDSSQDSDEMLRLEEQVHHMGPLIDAELERVDRKHAQLTQLSSELVDAINMYHTLMRDDRIGVGMSHPSQMPGYAPGFNPQQNVFYGPLQSNMFNPAGANVINSGHMSMPTMMQASQQLTNVVQRMPMANTPGQNPNTVPFTPSQPQSQLPQMIPMHFQNGHQNSPNQQQQHIITNIQGGSTANQQQLHQSQNFTAPTPQQNYQIPMQHSMIPPHSMQLPPQQQQQQGQFIQSMPAQQFSPRQMMLNNGQMMAPGGSAMPSMVGMIPPGMHQNAIPNMHHPLPGFSPQMAAINQPVTQTILGQQNDSKANIPIYQQQR